MSDCHAGYGGHGLQHRPPGLTDVVRHRERLLVHRPGHGIHICGYHKVAKYSRVLDHQHRAEVEEGTQLADQHPLAQRPVANGPDFEQIAAFAESGEGERATFVGQSPTHERAVFFRAQLKSQERERGLGLCVLNFTEKGDAVGGRLGV